MEVGRNRLDEVVRLGLAFVLRLALILGGLGFASVFAVALLVGGIYLIATGHPSGGYALASGALSGCAGSHRGHDCSHAYFDSIGIDRKNVVEVKYFD